MKLNVGKLSIWMNQLLHHYNEDAYWRMRDYVVSPQCKNWLKKYYYLFRIKRSDAFNNASMGTDINHGAEFVGRPHLPHGLNGIIISKYAKIGQNCKIYHQVTIATKNVNGEFVSASIGSNCVLGAKCTILGGVHIGDNVKVGANAVVTHDIPHNCSVGGVPAVILNEYTFLLDEV